MSCVYVSITEVVKSGQITDSDRLFNNIAVTICDKHQEIGIELGLDSIVLKNELETGMMVMKVGSKKAIKMLQLWRDSVAENDFTYSVLAAALVKHGFLSCARTHCFTSIGNLLNIIFFVHVLMGNNVLGLI